MQVKHNMERELTEKKKYEKDKCILFYMSHGETDFQNQYLLTKFWKRAGGSVSVHT